MQDLSKINAYKSEPESLGKALSQIRALASVSYNIMSGHDQSLYTDDVAHLLIAIRDLADTERYKLNLDDG